MNDMQHLHHVLSVKKGSRTPERRLETPSKTQSELELLYEELAAAVPAKKDQYQGLLGAANRLKAERLSSIAEPVFSDLAREFHLATEGELQGRFKRTGDLILAAVCDQSAGVSEAVNSLLPWLTDEARFSPAWIMAVTKTLDQARERVKNKKGIQI